MTPRVVEAIRRGLARKQQSEAWLAERVDSTRQAVGQILSLVTKRSELLVDMLRAVDEPAYLALDLSEIELALLDLSREFQDLSPEQCERLIEEFQRRVRGERALAGVGRTKDSSTDR